MPSNVRRPLPMPFVPVVLGGDIGAYATARAFHEAYGVRTVILAGANVGPVRDSAIVDLRLVPGLEDPRTLLAAVRDVAAHAPDLTHLVLASADWLVAALVGVADRLATEVPNVVVPYPAPDVVARASDKARVMAVCGELDVPHPDTAVLTLSGETPPAIPELTYPRVVKVASTTAAHTVTYAGQAKVHVVTDAAQLQDLLRRMTAAGLRGEVLVQQQLPGGDAAMAAANVFVGRDGAVRFSQLGRVLLEEHTPTALGNSVAQVTVDAARDDVASSVLDQVERLVTALGWSGFANVDLMRDESGSYRVLEINPRVGRSGYAVTASGYNVAQLYVREFLEHADPAPRVRGTNVHLFTVVPVLLLRVFARDSWPTVRRLWLSRQVTNPYYYRAERDPRRWWYIAVAMVNQVRKFARHHPASPWRRG